MSAAWGGMATPEDIQIGRKLLYMWGALSIAGVSLVVFMIRAGFRW